jgi:hypothetical protein
MANALAVTVYHTIYQLPEEKPRNVLRESATHIKFGINVPTKLNW